MRRVQNPERAERLMRAAIARLALDLRDIPVLTEAASGNFAITALLAALAGSPRVVALTADSRYGLASEVVEYVLDWATRLEVADRIEITTDRARAANAGSNLITNLGFVRPIDVSLIERTPVNSVVALMWEPWEFRAQDVDLAVCRRREIPVLGTRESDPRVRTFVYVGLLALKLLLENDIEVDGSEILVVGASPFLAPTVDVLCRNGSNVSSIAMDDPEPEVAAAGCDIGSFDAIVLVDHRSRREILGQRGLFSLKRIAKTGGRLIHICGCVDDEALIAAGVVKIPARKVEPGYMTLTTDYVGPRPVVDLHAAGLKVGEITVRSLRRGANYAEAVAAALESGLALDFDEPSGSRQKSGVGA